MNRSRSQWEDFLQLNELLWFHHGNPNCPHALLTAGGHSNGFANASKFLFDFPSHAIDMAADLVEIAESDKDTFEQLGSVSKVLSPAFGAITFGAFLAAAMNIGHAFTVPDGEGGEKKFKLEKRFSLEGEIVLPAEDVITSGDSVSKTIEIALASGATVVPYIFAVCNRSGLTEIGGRRIIAMIDKPMKNWAPEECPLCKVGSKAIRPKEIGNWALLTADYPQ